MPRMRKTVTVNDKEYTVRELTVQDIIDLMNDSIFFGASKGNKPEGKNDFVLVAEDLSKAMKKCCDFDINDLKPLPPSEIKNIYNAFMEVNATFLEILKALGMTKVLEKIQEAILQNFSKLLVTSLKQGI